MLENNCLTRLKNENESFKNSNSKIFSVKKHSSFKRKQKLTSQRLKETHFNRSSEQSRESKNDYKHSKISNFTGKARVKDSIGQLYHIKMHQMKKRPHKIQSNKLTKHLEQCRQRTHVRPKLLKYSRMHKLKFKCKHLQRLDRAISSLHPHLLFKQVSRINL